MARTRFFLENHHAGQTAEFSHYLSRDSGIPDFGILAAFGQSRRKALLDPPTPGDSQQRDMLADPADPKTAQQAKLQNRKR